MGTDMQSYHCLDETSQTRLRIRVNSAIADTVTRILKSSGDVEFDPGDVEGDFLRIDDDIFDSICCEVYREILCSFMPRVVYKSEEEDDCRFLEDGRPEFYITGKLREKIQAMDDYAQLYSNWEVETFDELPVEQPDEYAVINGWDLMHETRSKADFKKASDWWRENHHRRPEKCYNDWGPPHKQMACAGCKKNFCACNMWNCICTPDDRYCTMCALDAGFHPHPEELCF